MKKKNRIGMKIGNLTVLEQDPEPFFASNGDKRIRYICLCSCGNKKSILSCNLISKNPIISCGCKKKRVLTRTSLISRNSEKRIYRIWFNMKSRCNNKNNKNYKNYGGRGIYYCKEWNSFEVFLNWSISNGYTDNLSIERTDVNKEYSPSNCKWATTQQQSYNRRNTIIIDIGNESKCLKEWCDIYNSSYDKMFWLYKKNKKLTELDFINHATDKRLKNYAIIDGENKPFAEWCNLLGLTYATFSGRYKRLKCKDNITRQTILRL